ncbi:MAG: thiamine diphosphokinase [Mucinivorans sp.]
MKNSATILADGDFPSKGLALEILQSAQPLICCDGAADALWAYGIEPLAIVGDCDSISKACAEHFAAILHRNPDQETNDLTKAVQYCLAHQMTDLTILGATGKREDHTLGNISLLADYATEATVRMVTSHGQFDAINSPTTFTATRGQQVSVFALDNTATIRYKGLRYDLPHNRARSWWSGTLNQVLGDSFTIDTHTPTIIFRAFF